jgi:heptosyltransferase-1
MRVLVVKTSSLGDVVHTLPALTDAAAALPGVRFDWVVEEAFAEIPAWHPAVERVIPIALRRWRKGWARALSSGEIGRFRSELRRERYDLIIDAQGLIKSTLVARQAYGVRAGYDRVSAREPLAAWGYDRRLSVARGQHAIARVRQLFAQALGYVLPETGPDFGLAGAELGAKGSSPVTHHGPTLLFLHGTTWPTKHWPLNYWAELIDLANGQGLEVLLPWGNDEEKARAENLAADAADAWVLPPMGLAGLAREFRQAAGVVGLDSGLSHLAAALGAPGVTLYGPTRTELTGVVGDRHRNLAVDFACAPCLRRFCNYQGAAAVQPACFETLAPQRVWQALQEQMGGQEA